MQFGILGYFLSCEKLKYWNQLGLTTSHVYTEKLWMNFIKYNRRKICIFKMIFEQRFELAINAVKLRKITRKKDYFSSLLINLASTDAHA